MAETRDLLLVEDDAVTRELLTLQLSSGGWRVHAAGTGEAAIAWMQKAASAPALVLCDQNLPGICGADLARKILEHLQELPNGSQTILLGMTANVDAEAGTGYEGLLVKPFAISDVEVFWREASLRRHTANHGEAPLVAAYPGEPRTEHDAERSVLDEAVFTKLQQSMGNKALQGLYGFALADAGDRLQRMEEAARVGDGAKYVAEAHALKGSSGMVGARRLHALAEAAERAGAPLANKVRNAFLTSDGSKTEKHVEPMNMMRDAIAEIRLMLEALFPL